MNSGVLRPSAIAAAVVAAAMLMAGCTSGSVPALERAAEPADALPGDLTGFSGFDPETARHIASKDGVEYYLAKQSGDIDLVNGVCLVLTTATEPLQWASSCGAGDWFTLEWAPGTVNAEFFRHGVTAGDVKPGWTQVSENVIVEG
ncbi:hypothetical protein KNO15_00885 [Leifsonia shinshuensis]|uniref:hypothetical protein n=1 Tax=Leifsonia shinshuensis TaxID=150026 RepID=UPI001F504F5B|nr:hypothetical protein [Leifsonia shinshuensis]MCI0155256.1 hypothetical protein [Leifsonia shinshuensis]